MQDYILNEDNSGYILLETGGKLVLDIVAFVTENFKFVSVADNGNAVISVTEKIR